MQTTRFQSWSILVLSIAAFGWYVFHEVTKHLADERDRINTLASGLDTAAHRYDRAHASTPIKYTTPRDVVEQLYRAGELLPHEARRYLENIEHLAIDHTYGQNKITTDTDLRNTEEVAADVAKFDQENKERVEELLKHK